MTARARPAVREAGAGPATASTPAPGHEAGRCERAGQLRPRDAGGSADADSIRSIGPADPATFTPSGDLGDVAATSASSAWAAGFCGLHGHPGYLRVMS